MPKANMTNNGAAELLQAFRQIRHTDQRRSPLLDAALERAILALHHLPEPGTQAVTAAMWMLAERMAVPAASEDDGDALLQCLNCRKVCAARHAVCPSCNSAELHAFVPRFVRVGLKIMQGARRVAEASTANMARRIVAALNEHQPNKKGV